MPVNVISKPTRVVSTAEVDIDEFVGNASNGDPTVSIARVVSKGKWAEDWQTPDFDEWVLVLRGTIHIEHANGVSVVNGGEFVHLTKGERVRWVFPFPDGAEYVPVCFPAFSPNNAVREEGTGAPLTETLSSEHPYLYHMVQKELWEAAKAEGSTYYPPTYKTDGFTHATADPKVLLDVANHFYQGVGKDWVCLEMTPEALKSAGLRTVFEAPAPVGDTAAPEGGFKDGPVTLFPHIYGGIPGAAGAVQKEYTILRSEGGKFLSIEGLC